MTEITLQNISKKYGDFTALENLNCTIKSGELVALLGPSGCGKTTTLRMIAGLEPPTTGAILFDARDISYDAVQNRNVGMVFQQYALFPHMNVEKNITFGLDVNHVKKSEIHQRLNDILDIVQLHPFRKRFPSQLSGGQMQRVAIARTLITKPAVLMMDEPLANLDTKLRGEMRTFIKKIQREFNITTIFVTHDQIEAVELADRVAVIFDGKLAQYDTPETLYNTPKSLAVAKFMGADNMFCATIINHNQVQTDFGNMEVNLSHLPHKIGDTIHIIIRSETLHISQVPFTDTQLMCLQGTIINRVFFGATIIYGVKSNGQTFNVTVQSPTLINVGTPVYIGICPTRIWAIAE